MNLNLKFVSYNLGIVAVLIAAAMAFSLLWAMPILGGVWENEKSGVYGLVCSMLISVAVGGALFRFGWDARKQNFFRREAMLIVALSWTLATVLGAMPYLVSGTSRAVEDGVPVRMSVADAVFEAQSGFSTTGATVICVLDDSQLVPRTILFWRSTTHFMGGLGIIVLLVALLNTGQAGKFLMQREISGPLNSGNAMTRMRQTAICTLTVYGVICVAGIILMLAAGTSVFDAICHIFGAVATGGFSTHDASVGFFQDSPGVNWNMVRITITLVSFLCGMNLLLLYTAFSGKWRVLPQSLEWRTYVGMILLATVVIFIYAAGHGHLPIYDSSGSFSATTFGDSLLTCLFHVVAILTTTGFVTTDYSTWASPCLVVLILLMFVGGCAGSTSGGIKVVRVIMLFKIFGIEFERAYRPAVVRPLRYGNEIISDENVPRQLMVYLLTAVLILAVAWMLVVFLEPEAPWINAESGTASVEKKLMDVFFATFSMFGNIGPGLGIFGPASNYASLTDASKFIFALVMMLGRLEIFAVLSVFMPNFWRK